MSKIKIKNFGPIKEGFGDEWMDVKKVTVFIGNQGSGKSTVAKIISILTWLEKAINRGDVSITEINRAKFLEFLDYQRVKNYFNVEETVIAYEGDYMSLKYSKEKHYPEITIKDPSPKYLVPKIMYVPAERNFLSVIEDANNLRRMPPTLFTFAEEFQNGKKEFNGKEIPLPISNISFNYNEEKDTSHLIGEDYKVNLLEASSGYQSLVPLFIVTKYLTDELKKGKETLRSLLSVTQSIRRNEEIAKVVLNSQLSDDEKKSKTEKIDAKYLNVCFTNIVEEPEQNLFPSSQQQILNSLLEFNNMNTGNKLILTTHSPYLINYLTLCVKANNVYKILKDKNYKISDPEFDQVGEIVPKSSTLNSADLVIYEMNEKDGTIKMLGNFEGIPSDKNSLNKSLGKSNELFDSLLEIEENI